MGPLEKGGVGHAIERYHTRKCEIRNPKQYQNSNDQNGCLDSRIAWILNIRHSNSFQVSPWKGRKAEEISKYKCQNNQNGVSSRLLFWILNIRYSDLFRISCFEFRIFLLRIMFEVPYPCVQPEIWDMDSLVKRGQGRFLWTWSWKNGTFLKTTCHPYSRSTLWKWRPII